MSIRGLAVELFSERLSIYLRGNRFSYELAALQPKFMSLAELVGRCLIQPRPGGQHSTSVPRAVLPSGKG